MIRLSLARARSVWSAAQELGAGTGGFAAALERTGFVRTLGGVEVYLAARARLSISAREVDAVVAAHEAQVIPAVRGCIYLVAKANVPLALRVAEILSARTREREQEKAGIKPGELADVGRAVMEMLHRGPLTTDTLRRALPVGVLRPLGDAGKKAGLSSTLPPALRLLELKGHIERTLEGGRLDTERYVWRATAKNPFDGAKLPDDPIDLCARLAKLFFRAAGTSTVRVFSDWAGIGLRDGQLAVEKARLVPVTVEGIDEPSYTTHERADGLESARLEMGGLAFLPFEDNLIAMHGGPALLVDPQYHAIPVPAWGTSGPGTIGATKHMSTRSIVAEGRIVGLWEYDPRTKTSATAVFDWVAPSTYPRIEELGGETARFLSEEVGHGRSFSLDTDETLGERAELIRRIAKHGVKATLGDGKMMPGQRMDAGVSSGAAAAARSSSGLASTSAVPEGTKPETTAKVRAAKAKAVAAQAGAAVKKAAAEVEKAATEVKKAAGKVGSKVAAGAKKAAAGAKGAAAKVKPAVKKVGGKVAAGAKKAAAGAKGAAARGRGATSKRR